MKKSVKYTIREAYSKEFNELGKLMVSVYSQIEGFPSKAKIPGYYEVLNNIGLLSEKSESKLLVAVSSENELLGGVVYFGRMEHYGVATNEDRTSGIRFLAVNSSARGMGIGRALTETCIKIAKNKNHSQVILHTTDAMPIARRLYEKMGFKRSSDLDFEKQKFMVYGFRLKITST